MGGPVAAIGVGTSPFAASRSIFLILGFVAVSPRSPAIATIGSPRFETIVSTKRCSLLAQPARRVKLTSGILLGESVLASSPYP